MVKIVGRREIWLADFGEPVGHEQGFLRPGVITSVDSYNRSRPGLVLAIPTTTTKRGWRTHVEVGTHTGLKETSWALVEQLRAVSTQRLRRRIGEADKATMDRIDEIVRLLLGL